MPAPARCATRGDRRLARLRSPLGFWDHEIFKALAAVMLAARDDEPASVATQHLGSGPLDPSIDGDLGKRDDQKRDEKSDHKSHSPSLKIPGHGPSRLRLYLNNPRRKTVRANLTKMYSTRKAPVSPTFYGPGPQCGGAGRALSRVGSSPERERGARAPHVPSKTPSSKVGSIPGGTHIPRIYSIVSPGARIARGNHAPSSTRHIRP
jgi:hypothetical protein